jgi:LPXTG-motif cell wall-anchored protein
MWIAAATLGAMAFMGGTAAASDYPPGDESVTTVPQGGASTPARPGGKLPRTGSDSNSTVKIAGGAVAAGAGLLVASRLRARPSAG